MLSQAHTAQTTLFGKEIPKDRDRRSFEGIWREECVENPVCPYTRPYNVQHGKPSAREWMHLMQIPRRGDEGKERGGGDVIIAFAMCEERRKEGGLLHTSAVE